jgi:hypothetical protein
MPSAGNGMNSNDTAMDAKTLEFVEIINRLKRGTAEGRLLWERGGSQGRQFAVTLSDGHRATVAEVQRGSAVVFTMTNAEGAQTLHLDSARAGDDLLRLALLQLFVTVRDTLAHYNDPRNSDTDIRWAPCHNETERKRE